MEKRRNLVFFLLNTSLKKPTTNICFRQCLKYLYQNSPYKVNTFSIWNKPQIKIKIKPNTKHLHIFNTLNKKPKNQ